MTDNHANTEDALLEKLSARLVPLLVQSLEQRFTEKEQEALQRQQEQESEKLISDYLSSIKSVVDSDEEYKDLLSTKGRNLDPNLMQDLIFRAAQYKDSAPHVIKNALKNDDVLKSLQNSDELDRQYALSNLYADLRAQKIAEEAAAAKTQENNKQNQPILPELPEGKGANTSSEGRVVTVSDF